MQTKNKKTKFRYVWNFPGFGGWTAIFFGFLYVPIFVLVCYSFNSSKFAMIWTGFSFSCYDKLFSNDDIITATINYLISGISQFWQPEAGEFFITVLIFYHR